MIFTINTEGRINNDTRIIHILQQTPEARDSYEILISEFRIRFPDNTATDKTIMNLCGRLQHSLGIYPPCARVRRIREEKQAEIIAEARQKNANQSLLSRFKRFIGIG